MENRLPPKIESVVHVELSYWQRSAYEDLEKKTIRLMSSDDQVVSKKVNNVLMQLRKIALHPYLFTDDKDTGPEVVRSSGKVEVLDRMLPKLCKCGHQTLLFSQFTSVLDVLEIYLKWRDISFVRLDGQTPHEYRRVRIDKFNAGEANVFILSARAGGLGLNLQKADTVILFDLDWNPQNDKQAIARAHRIGQEREARVFRLLTCSGVERYMERRCNEKLELEKKIIGAGMFRGGVSQEQRVDALRSILGVAQGAVEPAEAQEKQPSTVSGSSTDPQELNRLLARTDEELAIFNTMDVDTFGAVECQTNMEAPFLVRCGRLMRQDEVPDGFTFREEEEEVEDQPIIDDPTLDDEEP